MRPTRRDVLRAASLGGAALAAPPLLFPSRRPALRPVDPAGTTLDHTVLRSATELRPGGYRLLTSGPGEPHLVRDELGVRPAADRVRHRKPVSVFVQFSDMHLLDAQSPARVEFLDRYSDAPGEQVPFDSAWRPQEAFTAQLCESLVRAVRAVRRGPVTGKPFEFTVCTGDNTDNAQLNETRWFVDVMDGGRVVPDSGDRSKWEGVQDADPTTYDVHYWHPDGPPSGKTADNGIRLYGFPSVKGLLDRARQPFDATGVGMPWYCVFGNHDPLLQGNAPAFYEVGGREVPTGFATVAVGTVKVVSVPAGMSPADVQRGLVEQDPAVLQALTTAPARTVSADADRRPISKREYMAEMFRTTGTPVGHGFARDNVTSGAGYYAFDSGQHLRCVVLDTVNPGGYSEGSLDRAQFDWLRDELEANAATRRLVAVFSHHASWSMTNPVLAPGETAQRVLGPAVVALLHEFPNVLLWVNGHSHRNEVRAQPKPGGGGFWEVNTAAHVDFPSQARLVEIVDNLDGTLSIFGTMVDCRAPLAYASAADYAAPVTPEALASVARELGANDWQARPADLNGGRRGTVESRNVELVIRAPFDLGLGGRRSDDVTRPNGTVTRPRTGPRIPDTGMDDLPASIAAALAVAAAGLAAARRRATTGGDTEDA